MNEDKNLKWIRNLSSMANMMYESHNNGYMIIRYVLRLCSKNLLEEEKMRMALIHLHRKVPTLRLCIRRRDDGKLWFRAMDNEAIDFQIGDGTCYDDERRSILRRSFNTFDGPLWRVRLFPCLPDTPFHFEHLREEFPYQYNLLFGFQHSITDGLSNIRICDAFLKILNDVLSGKTINDKEQIGHFVTSSKLEETLEKIEDRLLQDEAKFQYKIDLNEPKNVELIIDNSKRSKFPTFPNMETFSFDMTEEETRKLTLKCKSEGVTVNSALCTAVQAATIDILKTTSMKNDIYTFSNIQVVNIRRYWKDTKCFPLGECFGALQMTSKFPSDTGSKFWELAREFNEDFSSLVKNKRPSVKALVNDIDTMKRDKMLNPFLLEDSEELLYFTYMMSNCGDLSDHFSGEGENVQATHMSRSTSFKKCSNAHKAHTFRGRLHFALDYDAKFFSHEGVKLRCNTILRILRQVVDLL